MRGIGSFHPASMPQLSRAHYRREIIAWPFLAVMLSTVAGGVTGVLAKLGFEGVVNPYLLNIAVGILSGSPMFANISSFAWASLSRGRNKIHFLTGIQLAMAVLIASIALVPRNAVGLLVLIIAAVAARMCWSGIVTLRSTVWRANYPRSDRARMAGKFATLQVTVVALSCMAIGALMETSDLAFRIIYPALAAIGLIGVIVYRRMRVRGHREILRAEHAAGEQSVGLWQLINDDFINVLRDDRWFRRYMLIMFVFGFGNLMVIAPLLIMLVDRFGYQQFESVLIVATIPMLLMPVSIPMWSRFLDRVHIVHFRALHCWTFVAATLALLLGGVLGTAGLLYLGAILLGLARGGGMLGWNLGHHDFAPAHRVSQYMGVHVTLTGIRGLLAPLVAVGLYTWLESAYQTGPWLFAICLALNIIGAAGFIQLARALPADHTPHELGEEGPPISPPSAS